MVYLTVDIEDAIRKRVVRWNQAEEFLHGKVEPALLNNCLEEAKGYIQKGGLGMKGHENDEAMADVFAHTLFVQSSLQCEMSSNGGIPRYCPVLNNYGELTRDCSASSLVNACAMLGRTALYCAPQTLKLEIMGRTVITDLMSIFWKVLKSTTVAKTRDFPGKIFALFSHTIPTVFGTCNRGRDSP